MKFFSTAAGRGFLVLALGLAFAGVLDARGLRKQAEIQPAGAERNLALAVTRPLVRVSAALRLTTPRHELQEAIGRQDEDRIDSQVHLDLPPVRAQPPAVRAPRRAHGRPAKVLKPVFTTAHPLRVWVAGDSLAEVPGQALERIGGALDVVGLESRLSTGLARPDLYNWFTRVQQAPAELHPAVAVFSFGADDAHDYMAGVPGGKSVGLLGSPSWNAEYHRRVDGVTRELNAKGIHVVWLGLPIPDGPGFKKSFPVVNRILESVVAAHPKGATFVDTWHLLDDAHGRFATYLRVHGKLTLMRLPDGVHYTAAAGDLIAQALLAQLRGAYDLR
jgi:hypothetical protein